MQQHFYDTFGCLTVASPDVFFVASDEDVMQDASMMAKLRA